MAKKRAAKRRPVRKLAAANDQRRESAEHSQKETTPKYRRQSEKCARDWVEKELIEILVTRHPTPLRQKPNQFATCKNRGRRFEMLVVVDRGIVFGPIRR